MLSAVGGNVAAHPGWKKMGENQTIQEMRWVKTNEITIWLGEQLSVNQQIPNHNHVPFLVGGLEHVLFFHSVGKFILPTDFNSIMFQRGRENHQAVLFGERSCHFVRESSQLRPWFARARALRPEGNPFRNLMWGWSSGDDVDWRGEVSTYPGLSSWWFHGDFMVI